MQIIYCVSQRKNLLFQFLYQNKYTLYILRINKTLNIYFDLLKSIDDFLYVIYNRYKFNINIDILDFRYLNLFFKKIKTLNIDSTYAQYYSQSRIILSYRRVICNASIYNTTQI